MSFKFIMIGAAACLGGCQTANSHIGDENLGMGEAVRYNAAVQTINPVPVYPEDGAQPGDNGDKGAQAVRRFRNDQAKPVEAMQTTTGTPN